MKSLSKRNGFRSARVRHYFLAVVLPIITSVVASRFDTFSRTPYALSLLAIAFIASLGGIAPSILALQESAEALRQAELARSAKALAALTPEQREAVEAITRSLTNKLLHPQIVALRKSSE